MDVQPTPDQKAFIRRAIESGRLHSEQEAIEEALALWEQRERQRAEFLRQLANEAKERGRARLLAELTAPH